MSIENPSFSELLNSDLAGTYPRTASAGASIDPAVADSAPWGGGLRIGVESRAVINESC